MVAGCGVGGGFPGKRSAHVAVVHRGYMWAWGGRGHCGAQGHGLSDTGLYRIKLPTVGSMCKLVDLA